MVDHTMYSQTKLIEYADAFSRLVQIYEGNSRDALALQMRETAAMLEKISGYTQTGNGVYEEISKKLHRYLRGRGMIVNQIMVFENIPGRLQLILNIRIAKKGCVTSRELSMGISATLKKEFVPADWSRQVITAEDGEFIFEEAPDYRLIFGNAGCNKGFSRISGDNYSFINVEGGRTVISLADGMGCGNPANRASAKVIELLEQLLKTGFSEQCAVNLINSVFAANDWVGNPVTIDLCSVNGYDGTAYFIKMGAAASFIKSSSGVRVIHSSSLPAGVIENVSSDRNSIQLQDGDYVIMVSDGVLDALPFYDKEKRMKEIIEEVDERIPAKFAEKLLNEIFFYDDKITDDMTILVTGIWKRA